MKSMIAVSGILLTLLASDPALAQQDRGGRRFGPAGAARPAPKPASAPGVQASAGRGDRGVGPMTPEERQQLRRDVNNHGREIYRDRAALKRPQRSP